MQTYLQIFLNITDIVPVLRWGGEEKKVKLLSNNKEDFC